VLRPGAYSNFPPKGRKIKLAPGRLIKSLWYSMMLLFNPLSTRTFWKFRFWISKFHT